MNLLNGDGIIILVYLNIFMITIYLNETGIVE